MTDTQIGTINPYATGESPVVPAGTGRTLIEGPLGAILLAGAERTGGAISFVIHPLAPHALGSPLHTHTREDEWSFILEGQMGLELDGRTSIANAGDLVLKPRGIPHAFWNPGDEPARILEVITPSGFEDFFEAIGDIFAVPGEPDLEGADRVSKRFGLHLDLASVPRLSQAHGLRMG